MKSSIVVLSCMVAMSGTLACSGADRIDWGTWGRAMWQRPADVIDALAIKPGAQVADIGAGEGYFVPFLADAVGAEGRVYAVDVEADLVDALNERFGGDAHVTVVLGEYEDPLLPDGALDLVLLVNTYHHIQDRVAYFNRLRRVFVPGGRLAIVEPDERLSGFFALFVTPEHESHPGAVQGELEAAGWRRVAAYELLPIQVFHVYEIAPD